MKAIGVCETMQQVRIERTTKQSNQFVETANVEPGFVALSKLTDGIIGAHRLVPEEFCHCLPQGVARWSLTAARSA
ncbi:hypothetical protein MA20_45670 [Bradyrhizobium japonicum]|uniref:Uncharacterized protein n=1 Tax=Bradyrhizobium japonicum TaxID=375 RepID=A0A0A3YHP6_BRAJP|nr:hypothetical protein MA20_45670 [Bradyrhizobium japonicum]